MKIYYGTNTGPGPQLIWVLPELNAKPYRLRHFVQHSPDGFSWGYSGSGCAEAARCILIDCIGAGKVTPALYQAFKRAFIAPAGAELHIPEAAIQEWVANQTKGGSNEKSYS